MEAVALTNHELEMEDVEYLRHGDTPYLLRLHKPAGNGPFPLIVQLHGGAWCRGDRMNDSLLNEALAKSGVVVAALEWRMPPIASYPAALTDINYAIRWLKSRATDLRSRPDLVGIMGSSSGGHQAMLAAMRPRDSRYSALPLSRWHGASRCWRALRCSLLAGHRSAGAIPLRQGIETTRRIGRGVRRPRAAQPRSILGQRNSNERRQPRARAGTR